MLARKDKVMAILTLLWYKLGVNIRIVLGNEYHLIFCNLMVHAVYFGTRLSLSFFFEFLLLSLWCKSEKEKDSSGRLLRRKTLIKEEWRLRCYCLKSLVSTSVTLFIMPNPLKWTLPTCRIIHIAICQWFWGYNVFRVS